MMKVVIIFAVLLFATAASLGQCPNITVTGPTGLTNSGEEIEFHVRISAADQPLEYEWSVSTGIIFRGQGTETIFVLTPRTTTGVNITATALIRGINRECRFSASTTATVVAGPVCTCYNEWGKISPNLTRAQIDALFAELQNNPSDIGFVLLTVPRNKRLAVENHQIRFYYRHAKFRKFDIGRVWFALEFGNELHTKVWRIPPGGETPCDNCVIIKGSDLK